jgi:hypothetical protein
LRSAVLIVALATVFALVPASATGFDECVVAPASGIICQKIEANPGSPAPQLKAHYLWIGPGNCVSGTTPTPGNCAGTPNGQGVFGILYEESNGVGGLQRNGQVINGVFKAADKIVLV